MPERKGLGLYNVIVIGAGTADPVVAIGTAALGEARCIQPAAESAGTDLITESADKFVGVLLRIRTS